jgi:hypothetical protein
VINHPTEQLIRLKDVPTSDILPDRKLSRATAYRWALCGIRGVKLETIKAGGARYTSREAVQRFFET